MTSEQYGIHSKPTAIPIESYKGAPHSPNQINRTFFRKMWSSRLQLGEKLKRKNEFGLFDGEHPAHAALRALELNTKQHTLPDKSTHLQTEAGNRHFHATWVVDHAKSWPSLLSLAQGEIVVDGQTLTSPTITMDTLASQVKDLSHVSERNPKKTVYTGVLSRDSKHIEGVNIPHDRADSLPALIYNIALLQQEGRDLFAEVPYLMTTVNDFLESYIKDYTLGKEDAYNPKGGDWVDTVRRKFPTWNVLWQLKMQQIIEGWQQKGMEFDALKHHPEFNSQTTTDLLTREYIHDERNGGDGQRYLIDYAGKDVCSTDANVLALQLELFDPKMRMDIVHALEGRPELFALYPMLMMHIPYTKHGLSQSLVARLGSRRYHSVIWPHMGAMYIQGLLKLAEHDPEHRQELLDYATPHLKSLNECIERFGFAETIDPKGKSFNPKTGRFEPGDYYKTLFIRSENPLTMFAANYLGIYAIAQKMKEQGIAVDIPTIMTDKKLEHVTAV